MEDFVPILHRRVIPHFLGKDARDVESLVDDVYIANYKLSGQAFWCPVAYVEQSLFDLLGKTARKPAAELMAGCCARTFPSTFRDPAETPRRRKRSRSMCGASRRPAPKR